MYVIYNILEMSLIISFLWFLPAKIQKSLTLGFALDTITSVRRGINKISNIANTIIGGLEFVLYCSTQKFY